MGKEPKKEKKLPPAPTIIRGRVSTGKRMVLDDSDDESDAVRPKVNSEEKKKNTTKKELNEKGESSDVVHKVEKTEESNPKKNSSGILSVTNIKTKGKAKFSLAELEGEDSSIGLGNCQW